MAPPERRAHPSLIEALGAQGHRFGFFQAIQLLHRLAPRKVALGYHGPPEAEPVRLQHDVSLRFPASDIAGITIPPDDGGQAVVTTTFLGLTGAVSPLASHFSEAVLDAELNDEHSLRAFYDLWHHRALSLFFRAWKKYRFPATFRASLDDEFTRRALALIGIDAASIPTRGPQLQLQLSLAPLLAMRSRPERTLRIILGRMFPGVPVRIEQFVARRARIDPEDALRLARANCRLNRDMVLGAHCEDRSGRFRLILGPLPRSRAEAFLPGGADFPRLRDLVDQFTRGVLECELEVRVRAEESPQFQLGGSNSLLGVTTQLAGRPRKIATRVVLSDDLAALRPRLVSYDDDISPANDAAPRSVRPPQCA